MKLMGISKLDELARRSGDVLSGAIPALVAELEGGEWQSMDEISDYFPLAVVDGIKIRIALGDRCHVDLLADCDAQMILIESVCSGSGARTGKTGRKAA